MTATLEYIKTILQKVSFDGKLFEKELKKALTMLVPDDAKQLRNWCYEQFSNNYTPVLNQCFSQV
jgi:hypothetical protein